MPQLNVVSYPNLNNVEFFGLFRGLDGRGHL